MDNNLSDDDFWNMLEDAEEKNQSPVSKNKLTSFLLMKAKHLKS